MILKELFAEIRSDFTSLWDSLVLGDTLEVVTPYSTIAGDVISVFVTMRNNQYIITDGARIDLLAKSQGVNIIERKGCHLCDVLTRLSISEHRSKSGNNLIYRLKKTEDLSMISSYVYDMIHFIDSMANAIMLESYFTTEEDLIAKKFSKKVNDVLRYKINMLPKAARQVDLFRNKSARALQFSSALIHKTRDSLWLGMCINGSNYSNFIRSVQRAEFGFNHASDTELALHNEMQFATITDSINFGQNERVNAIQNVISKWAVDHSVRAFTLGQIKEMDITKLWRTVA